MKKEVLIFDVIGYAAHFRKFYTNSSSLSYSVPPRTTIAGLIAAILGLERDSYYEDFSVENVDLAVRKNNKTRKIMQSLNYMQIKSRKDFEFPKNHTQIPFELILGERSFISYRIYFSSLDKNLMDKLELRLEEKRYYYTPSLGALPFNCNIEYIGKVQGKVREDKQVLISSIIPIKKIEERGIEIFQIDEDKVILVKERMAREFKNNREIKSVESYIYDENTNGIPVRLNGAYINLKYENVNENILFM